MQWTPPAKARDWDALVEDALRNGGAETDLVKFEQGSSALLAALCRVKVGVNAPLELMNAPDGLMGLARVAGVQDWFVWNDE